MAEQYRVTYYNMSLPADAPNITLIVPVMADSADEATELADAQVDHDTFIWVDSTSEREWQEELTLLEQGYGYDECGSLVML